MIHSITRARFGEKKKSLLITCLWNNIAFFYELFHMFGRVTVSCSSLSCDLMKELLLIFL